MGNIISIIPGDQVKLSCFFKERFHTMKGKIEHKSHPSWSNFGATRMKQDGINKHNGYNRKHLRFFRYCMETIDAVLLCGNADNWLLISRLSYFDIIHEHRTISTLQTAISGWKGIKTTKIATSGGMWSLN